MTAQTFTEIEAAKDALERQIILTEIEVAGLKQTIKERRKLIRSWRKAQSALSPPAAKKKMAAEAAQISGPI